jgi:hypothetical protein
MQHFAGLAPPLRVSDSQFQALKFETRAKDPTVVTLAWRR